MRPALAAVAAALLAAGCAQDADESGQQSAVLTATITDECLSRGDPAERSARQAALASAAAPSRRAQVYAIAGERPERVVDRAEILGADAERTLTARFEALEADTTDQLVVATVPSLGGLSIEEFGLALGNGWAPGRHDLDNGVLLVVAPSERRIRIEAGCGLEPVLTDDRAAEIVAKMIPLFHAGEFEKGVAAGAGEIEATLRARPERHNAP